MDETHWHFTQRVERLDDGRLRVHFDIDGLSEITPFVLSYSSHVVVEAPEDFRAHVIREIRATAARYEDSPTPGDE